MATPHILGRAALLRQHKPAASVAKSETSLFKSAVRPTVHRNGARQSRNCQRHCRFELPATLIYKLGMKAQIDPQLSKAIRSSRASGNTIHAAFTLRDDNNGNGLSPEVTDRIVKDAVAKAVYDTAAQPGGVVVFKNLQSFAIEAQACLVEWLASDDAVQTGSLGS